MKFSLVSLSTLLIALLFSALATANNLVNKYQLQQAFEQIVEDWDIEVVKNIKHYQDIEVISFDDVEGYSSGLRFSIRAQMYPDRRRDTVEVFALPAIAYFPDDPTQLPLKIMFSSVEVPEPVQQKVIDDAEVKVPLNAMSGEKSLWIVYGQTVLDDTQTTYTADGNRFVFDSLIDISNMSESDAVDYFFSFQGLVSKLNAELQKITNVQLEEWYEDETDAAEDRQDRLKKLTYAEITDKDVFTTLVGWQLHSENQVEEPTSPLGHWAYDDPDADEEYNVGIEVINFGDHYEMLYLIAYDEALDDDEAELNAMLSEVQSYASKKPPQGAASVIARATDYYGVGEVVVTYSLESQPTGAEIYDNAEEFSAFVKKTYSKSQRIAESY